MSTATVAGRRYTVVHPWGYQAKALVNIGVSTVFVISKNPKGVREVVAALMKAN